MTNRQPKVLARGLLATGLLGLLSGGALIAPGVQVQGAQRARLATIPATWYSVQPHQVAAKRRGSSSHSHQGGPTRTHSTTATIVVTPPIASHVRHAVRLHWSEATAARHIFGMGLTAPRRDDTFVLAHVPAARARLGTRAVAASVDLSPWDPPVGNQGQVNASASWATGYTALGWYAKHDGLAGSPYAPMYVYAQLVNGHNASSSFESNFAIEQHGVDTQADYHQGNDNYSDAPTSAEKANAANYHITGYTTVYMPGSGSAQAAIETALAAGRPVVVGLPVYSNFMSAAASDAIVDLPPPGAAYYGDHGVVGVKYDANGLWVENQWGTGWGLNGYAELSWSFVNRYLLSAYTINGFQAPSKDTSNGDAVAPAANPPSGAPAAPVSAAATATPAGSPSVTVSPSSGAPGSQLTISGSGFGNGLIALYSNGVLMVLVSSMNGSFSQAASISAGSAPGPRTILAVNQGNGRQASTIFTVTGSSPTATTAPTTPAPTSTSTPPSAPTSTSTPPATATRPVATSTSTPPPAPTNTSTLPATATKPPATSTPSGTAMLSLNPPAGATRALVAVTGSGFRPNELVTITWDSAPLVYELSTSQGTLSYQFTVPSSASAGAHTVTATGASGIKASATFTVNSGSSATATATAAAPSATPTRAAASPTSTSTPTQPTATPTKPAASPTATPAQPTATPTPPNGIPTSGTTSNGCQITPDSGAAEAQLIGLLNQDRASAGVAPLTLNSSLSTISRTHSCDMFLHQQLSHNGSDGSTPYTRMAAGGFGMPPYSQEGENIGDAAGMSPSQAVAMIDAQMMAEPDSPGTHHWNIVNSGYTIVGVGVIVANGQTWLTEDFAG